MWNFWKVFFEQGRRYEKNAVTNNSRFFFLQKNIKKYWVELVWDFFHVISITKINFLVTLTYTKKMSAIVVTVMSRAHKT